MHRQMRLPMQQREDTVSSLECTFDSGNTSLSMFQLTYPTIMTEQMKSLRRKTLRTHMKDDDLHSDCNSLNYDQTCIYENSAGQSMPMTLVETISFSTSDFTDNFLTCPTCLCSFDEAARLPRLLPCSHTICRECLERIIISNETYSGGEMLASETIRCPVCREAILMPRGGLNQLPPSYLINQLMDMIKQKQTRDYIPKCTVHSNESLLFCETCDSVFCSICERRNILTSTTSTAISNCCHTNGSGVSNSEHMIVPFAVAIKRVSEIVNYKSNQCTQLLDSAVMAIRQEMDRLDMSVQLASDAVHTSFEEICAQIEQRKMQLINSLCKLKHQKMQSLAEQLEIVQAERISLDQNKIRLLRNPDIRKLTNQIQLLNSQVESGHLLAEPRENSFLKFEFRHNQSLADLTQAIVQFGRIRVSNTYPPLCTARVDGSVANVRCSVSVTAMDYNGNVQNVGGDPLSVNVTDPIGNSIKYNMDDSIIGSYNINFLPDRPGRYKIDVKIFNRPIRGSPLSVEISEHNNPVWSRGQSHMIQTPVGLILDDDKLFVLDSESKQIIVLNADTGLYMNQLCSEPWITLTTTGFCLISKCLICTVDWKQKKLLIFRFCSTTMEVNSVDELSHNCRTLVEPILIAFSPNDAHSSVRHPFQRKQESSLGFLVIFDSDSNRLYVLDVFSNKGDKLDGLLRNSITLPCSVRSIALSYRGYEMYFSGYDQYLYICNIEEGTHRQILQGCYPALSVDRERRLLAARCDGRKESTCSIEVFSCENIMLIHRIDSFMDNLRRPYALTTDHEGHVFCADFTGRSVKKYRYA